MLISVVRFWLNGWIDKLYIQPDFFFSYYGFEFVKPLGVYTYLIFIICGLSALFIALGFKYRIAIIAFFLSFTYIELMDKTTYLNHYYFISVLSFLMIFLPANAYYSLDAKKNAAISFERVPRWTIDSIKLLLGIVYFYAGLAKLNSDWLIHAMPLKIWLPSNYDLPLIGSMMDEVWLHYAFSWAGALYDLTIPFILLNRNTRIYGFVAVVVFHVLTRLLFPIGMFPFIMILSTLIFFSEDFHKSILSKIRRWFNISKESFDNGATLLRQENRLERLKLAGITLFFVVQLLMPFRHYLYPGELFWTEEGFRFSWRVMLMEKAGYANFKIVHGNDGQFFYVDNAQFLTAFQEKQMATQPDFILEYAHYLADHYQKQGLDNLKIYVESYVALNGRRSVPFIDPSVDLLSSKESFKHKPWILAFNDEIKGL